MDGRSGIGELNMEVPSNDVPTSFNMRELVRKLLLSMGIYGFSLSRYIHHHFRMSVQAS